MVLGAFLKLIIQGSLFGKMIGTWIIVLYLMIPENDGLNYDHYEINGPCATFLESQESFDHLLLCQHWSFENLLLKYINQSTINLDEHWSAKHWGF